MLQVEPAAKRKPVLANAGRPQGGFSGDIPPVFDGPRLQPGVQASLRNGKMQDWLSLDQDAMRQGQSTIDGITALGGFICNAVSNSAYGGCRSSIGAGRFARGRLAEYAATGTRLAKWRAVIGKNSEHGVIAD